MRKHVSRPAEQVFAVTGLSASLRDDQNERMRRYLLSMGIRTGCFVLAVVALTVLRWTVVGWLLVIAAVVLPYIAVVMANATRSVGSVTLAPVTAERAPDRDANPKLSPDDPDEEPPP